MGLLLNACTVTDPARSPRWGGWSGGGGGGGSVFVPLDLHQCIRKRTRRRLLTRLLCPVLFNAVLKHVSQSAMEAPASQR